MSGIMLLICFVIAIVLMIVMISKLNIHPFLAIMVVSFLLAIAAQIPLTKIPSIITQGFSGIFGGIGIVIIFGALIGMILEKTGAALKLADIVVSALGEKRPELAMLVMGWIVGIPVFCDSGFVVLNPIKNALRRKIAANPVGMSVALSGGLYASHVLIPPTPGPIAAAGALGVEGNLLLVILMGAVVSIPVLFSVYCYAKFIDKRVIVKDSENLYESYEEIRKGYGNLPSGFVSILPILAPILLMAIGSVVAILKAEGLVFSILTFLGTPVIALGVGVLCGVVLLAKSGKLPHFNAITDETLKVVGPILFITAAGGVLGKVITAAGFVEFMKENAHAISFVGIFFPFVISAILKTAQGSSTVAIVTTAAIMGLFGDANSMMAALGLTTQMAAVLTVMAIGVGAMCVSHANDSYFWVVTNFSQMSPQQGYKTQTVMTLIAGIVGMFTIWVISLILL